ncbi:MAG: hypothetical protein ACYSU0_22765, partial [Planctomycetota bacterium]
KKVTTAVPGLPLEVAILDKQDERLGRIHEAIVEYFVNQTSMFGTTGVANAVSRLGGDARDVWSKLPTEEKKPQTELTEWTDMRHEIVHQGKSPRLIREEGWRCVRFVKALVEAIDHVVAKLLEAPPE